MRNPVLRSLAILVFPCLLALGGADHGKKNPQELSTPTSKDDCKKGGWRKFNNPTFKNQGDCVSFVESRGRGGALAQQEQRLGVEHGKGHAITGTLVDATCKEKHPQSHCYATASTSAFGLVLPDGKFVKVNATDNSKILAALKTANKQLADASINVSVIGMVEGDTVRIESVHVVQ